MKRYTKKTISGTVLAAAVVAALAPLALLAEETPKLTPIFVTQPWTGPAMQGANKAPEGAVSPSIPMSTFSFAATKDGRTYSVTLVGTNPFTTPSGATIPVVVVPVKVTIGTTAFDPSAANTCDGNVSAVTRFNSSPLVQSAALSFNGVSVGTTQFVNGFMRAEFWTSIGGSAGYQNTLSPVTYAAEVSVTAPSGSLYSSGCTQLGIVSYSWFSNYLNTELATLTSSGVVGPTKFVIFLVKNIVQSTANPPSTSGCCILGFHSAKGIPVQTWGVMDWDTTGDFGINSEDAAISSHEIGEWMNDPLGNNATPAWGNIDQVGGCQGNFEVGDPLSGTATTLTLNSKTYHLQELGFFSWYYNKLGAASLGTGGKFSGNGTFKGPSKACPPGGTN